MRVNESPFLISSGSSCTSNSWLRPPTHGTGRRSAGTSERFSSGVVRVEARFADLALLEQGQLLELETLMGRIRELFAEAGRRASQKAQQEEEAARTVALRTMGSPVPTQARSVGAVEVRPIAAPPQPEQPEVVGPSAPPDEDEAGERQPGRPEQAETASWSQEAEEVSAPSGTLEQVSAPSGTLEQAEARTMDADLEARIVDLEALGRARFPMYEAWEQRLQALEAKMEQESKDTLLRKLLGEVSALRASAVPVAALASLGKEGERGRTVAVFAHDGAMRSQ